MHVLVVDDSDLVRARLADRLNELPVVTGLSEASTIAGAAAALLEQAPDVAILDLRIPGGNGLELVPSIRKISPGATVIILTNYPFEQYRQRSLQVGADFFFDKSVEFDAAVDVVRGLGATADDWS